MAFELVVIEKAIEVARIEINRKNLSVDKKKQLNELLSLSPSEYASFQETKSILQAAGVISLETATFVYNCLGNWRKLDLAEKYVLTSLFARFLTAKQRLTA